MVTTWLGLLWGLAQGMRHAVEPDHLAAVSTLVAERRSARSAATYAVVWGAGHALVLLVVGGSLLLLRARLSERAASAFELLVAAMLVLLGVRALRRAIAQRSSVPATIRESHAHVRWLGFPTARQPLVVGCIHGLAGSGALAALVLAQMRSVAAGLFYMALYGGGAALGMGILAGLAGVPLAHVAKTKGGFPALLATTGVLSLTLGVAWGWVAAGPVLSR
jgi:hypothetical protein